MSNKKSILDEYGAILDTESGDVTDSNRDDDDEERIPVKKKSFSQEWGWIAALNSLCDDGKNLILKNMWLKTSIIEFLNQLTYLEAVNNERK